MRVLLVAPRIEDLPNVDQEISSVVNSGLTVRLLSGHVTRLDMVREISNNSYDMLWLATHGTQDGVYLSDGVLDASSLITYVSSSEIRHVFLNTCESIFVANTIAQSANTDVVATIGQIDDTVAFQTGAMLAKHLSSGHDFRRAYELSKPGKNENYVYLSGTKTTRRSGPAGVDNQAAIISHIEQQLRRVTTLIDGDTTYGIPGIRKDLVKVLTLIKEAQEEVDHLGVELDALRAELQSILSQMATDRQERERLREMLHEERRQREQIQHHLQELSGVLVNFGAKIPDRRAWYLEWAGPILSLVTIGLLFWMLG